MSGLFNGMGNLHGALHKIDPLDKAANKAVFGTDNPWKSPDIPVPKTSSVTNYEDDGTGKATGSSTLLYGQGATNGNERLRTAPAPTTSGLLGG